jgi:transcriptional regulator with XRE-family HTH domain
MIQRALDATTGGIERLAEEMGVSHNTVWSWKAGRRNPSPENLRKLADVLRKRGDSLTRLADELDREAGVGE